VNLPFLLLIAILTTSVVGVLSCRRIENSSTTTYRDTTVVIKGETVGVSVTDSIMAVLRAMKEAGKTPSIEYRNTPESKTSLVLSLDENGKLHADCKDQDEMISFLIKEINNKKTQTIEVEKVPWYFWAIFGVQTVGLIVAIIK
jgi:hypothetical protein